MNERITELIRECCAIPEEDITAETEIKDLSLDSLSFVKLVVKIEAEFNIEFDYEHLSVSKFIKVGDIMQLAEELAFCENDSKIKK